jgi:hypothetical protein
MEMPYTNSMPNNKTIPAVKTGDKYKQDAKILTWIPFLKSQPVLNKSLCQLLLISRKKQPINFKSLSKHLCLKIKVSNFADLCQNIFSLDELSF